MANSAPGNPPGNPHRTSPRTPPSASIDTTANGGSHDARPSRLRRIPYRVWLLAIFLIAFVASAIQPRDPLDFALEHTFSAAFLGLIIWIEWRERRLHEQLPNGAVLSNLSCTLILSYMLLHVLGAHYTYSFVPYDEWANALFGQSVSEAFGWRRNHYDRLVHFAFGVLMLLPCVELLERFARVTRNWAIAFSIALLSALSHAYELIEWLFALFMNPEAAETYNGQQGDIFDAHKDMGLALVGSIFAGLAVVLRRKA